jgi:predicted GH43/DUF377 family glycosyl hydrolase
LYYRAVDARAISSIGHAIVTRDMKIAERPDLPAIVPDQPWEELGCEDPRITSFGNSYYMLYTAYSRRGPRIALAKSPDLREFEKIGVIGPDLPDKDAALFPETFDGKLVLIHRIEPSIRLAYFEADHFERLADLSARSQYWMQYLRKLDTHILMKPQQSWEERKVGLGITSIEQVRL